MSGDCNNRFGPAQQWVIPFSRVQKNHPTTNHLLNNQKVSAIFFRGSGTTSEQQHRELFLIKLP
jgi:hypothetical protein